MNIPYEFSKVKDSFIKVKKDMEFLSKKITDNYEQSMKSHQELSSQIKQLSESLNSSISHTRENKDSHSEAEIKLMKEEIRELKKELEHVVKHNNSIVETHSQIKSNKEEIEGIKKKLQSSELEVYLLKERMIEKDVELKQIKEISSHLFNVVEELSKLELELISKKR